MRVKALQEENEKLRRRLGELEQSVARLQRQVADAKGDESKAKEALKESKVRLAGPHTQLWQLLALLSCVSGFRRGKGFIVLISRRGQSSSEYVLSENHSFCCSASGVNGRQATKSLGNRADEVKVGNTCVGTGIPIRPDIRHTQLLYTEQRPLRTLPSGPFSLMAVYSFLRHS